MNLRVSLLRKRVLLPLLALVLLGLSLAIAIRGSAATHIVVYNQSGSPITGLRLTACGQSRTFQNLADEDSVHWTLAATGAEGEIELEIAMDPPWRWRGGYVAPRGGYRVTVRLWPDGEVESHTQISLWQRLLNGTLRVDD